MPAEIVVMEDCASNYGRFDVLSSDGTKHYEVSLHGSEGGASCTCPAFLYSGAQRDCKHIRRVWEQACLYNPQWRDAKAEPIMRPEAYTYEMFSETRCVCGGPMVYVKRAV